MAGIGKCDLAGERDVELRRRCVVGRGERFGRQQDRPEQQRGERQEKQ
jgi:hypothetical protein